MKNLLIAANWKSNKIKNEARNWIFEISREKFKPGLELVIFPPFTLLDFLDSFIKANGLAFKLGAQDLSKFETGPYTGEISARQIKEFASYVIIGHSERRNNFSENIDVINQKVKMANAYNITPIVCISTLSEAEAIKTDEEIIIAYEPIGAISTSSASAKAESPDKVEDFAKELKKIRNSKILYGGSVSDDNIRDYAFLDDIDGVLVGKKSLDASSFINLLNHAV